MSDYDEAVDVLAGELEALEVAVRALGPDEWARTTRLVPFDPSTPRWDIKQLVAHIDISIGLTQSLLDTEQSGQPGRDRVSFFIADRSQVAPVVYDYAVALASEHTPESLCGKLAATFRQTIDGCRAHGPETIGSGFFALMRLDEWVPTRTVEAVVHGLDVTDALGAACVAQPAGLSATAAILDELLARRAVAGRPADLDDDLAFIRAASGRAEHPDPRLPLIV